MPGYGEPPKEHQFSTENQPLTGGRRPGAITTFLREYGDADELIFHIVKVKDGVTSEATSQLSTNGRATINQAIAARLLQMGLNGDMKAIKEILNRTEGRVPQPLNIGGQGNDNAIVVTYMPENGRRKKPGSVGGIPEAKNSEQ